MVGSTELVMSFKHELHITLVDLIHRYIIDIAFLVRGIFVVVSHIRGNKGTKNTVPLFDIPN